MKKTTILSIVIALLSIGAQAQTVFNFESNHNLWSGANSTISLSAEHSRDGQQGLKWVVSQNTSMLTLEYTTTSISCQTMVYMPIYTNRAGDDRIKVSFYNGNTLIIEGIHDLNYQGWLPFHRLVGEDLGRSISSGTRFNKIVLTYVPGVKNTTNTLWIDAVCTQAALWSAVGDNHYYLCQLGPQAASDYKAGKIKNRNNMDISFLDAFLRSKELTDVITPSQANINDVATINTRLAALNPSGKKSFLTTATSFVTSLAITTNSDGSINATSPWVAYNSSNTGIPYKACCDYISALAYDAIAQKNDASKNNLIKLTQFLLDYGVAPGGGPIGFPPSDYTSCREFAIGFLYAMPIFDEFDTTYPGINLRSRILDLLNWVYAYGVVYGTHDASAVTLDNVHTKTDWYFHIAAQAGTNSQIATEYRRVLRFLENMSTLQEGTLTFIKPDGAGFHHSAIHNSYMYGVSSWVNQVNRFRNTSYKIDKTTYDNIVRMVKTYFVQCVIDKGECYYSNSQCGRGPFNLKAGIGQSNLETLASIGKDILGGVDTEFNQFIKTFYPSSTLASEGLDMSGFYQINYANMGIYRHKDWVVTMRGLSSKFWGTEIYSNANRFGRYQSYGTTEIMYNGGLARNGYPTNSSWDWNVVPGTTTTHTTWKELNLGGHEATSRLSRGDEFQKNDFAGALTSDSCGMFAINFVEDPVNTWGGPTNRYTPTGLTFKKSVFACDSILVCLGSGIKSSFAINTITATNLFQNILSSSVGNMYLNQENAATDGTTTTALTGTNDYWMVTPAGTGYYLTKNNECVVKSVQGTQKTPNGNINYNTTPTAFPLIENQVAKAWIEHENYEIGDKYEYIIVPGQTPKSMKQFATSMSSKLPYSIIAKNNDAHIIHFPQKKITGFAIFDTNKAIANNPILSWVSQPCMVITRKPNDATMLLSVCIPDAYAKTTLSLDIKGNWRLEKGSDRVTLGNEHNGVMTLSVDLANGLPEQITLTDPVSGCKQAIATPEGAITSYDAATNTITVRLRNNEEKIKNILMLSTDGATLPIQENIDQNKAQLHIAPLNGIYILQITTDSHIYQEKICL